MITASTERAAPRPSEAGTHRVIRLWFLIRALHHGGTERQLTDLVRALDKVRFDVTVVTYYPGGALRAELADIHGVRLVSLDKGGRWDVAVFLTRLVNMARKTRPHVVHGYLVLGNELALLVGRLVGARVVWGLRASDMQFEHYDRARAVLFRVGAALSRFADLIIVNSEAGRRYHAAEGYSAARMRVIPNGIDVLRFSPDDDGRRRFRATWGVPLEAPLIGLVGRLDPMKGHEVFLLGAKGLSARMPEARYICIGAGPEEFEARLRRLAEQLGIADRLIWAGGTDAMADAYNGLDVATSASLFGEGFSNTTAEAMACGVPCVVTDVGDSAFIVGATGEVVPPDDPGALAAAWEGLLSRSDSERREIGRRARARVLSEFTIERLARRTEDALLDVIARRGAGGS